MTCASGPRASLHLIPGNHDRREPMREVFADHEYLHRSKDGIQYTIESPVMRIIALNSSEPGHRGGFLSRQRLSWLNDRLNERPRTPTIVALHHPPFLTHVAAFDAQPFWGREELAAIVRRHQQVRRIICGHVHQMIWRAWSGAVAVSAPSTAPTLTLNVRGVVQWQQGGFLLHH